MAVKLRLVRMGKTKQPTYRIVAADSRAPRNGKFIELLGTYQPRLEPSALRVDADKVNKWLATGAQPTERVQKILVAEGVLTGEGITATMAGKKQAKRKPKESKKIIEAREAEAQAKIDAAAAAEAAKAEAAEAAAAAKAAAEAPAEAAGEEVAADATETTEEA
jgi:small subunit ribosomal protein S16